MKPNYITIIYLKEAHVSFEHVPHKQVHLLIVFPVFSFSCWKIPSKWKTLTVGAYLPKSVNEITV